MTTLNRQTCEPCHAKSKAATAAEKKRWMREIPGWSLVREHGIPTLRREFKTDDFAQALAYANKIGAVAEKQDHHPDLLVQWGKLTVSWSTHAIKNLHRNDFVMAAKTNQLVKK